LELRTQSCNNMRTRSRGLFASCVSDAGCMGQCDSSQPSSEPLNSICCSRERVCRSPTQLQPSLYQDQSPSPLMTTPSPLRRSNHLSPPTLSFLLMARSCFSRHGQRLLAIHFVQRVAGGRAGQGGRGDDSNLRERHGGGDLARL
jgi:hypothetical protein